MRKSVVSEIVNHEICLVPPLPRAESQPLIQTLECFVVVAVVDDRTFRGAENANSLPLLSLSLSFSSLSHLICSTLLDSNSVSIPTLDMSTSTSLNSPLGECVVCGKESSTRCSSCAKGGVEWMFFCSRDHQKLVSAVS